MNYTSEVQSDLSIDYLVEKLKNSIPLDLILLGPTCCGKSTQAKKFSDFFIENLPDNSIHLINTGDLLATFSKSSENPQIINEAISIPQDRGDLVDLSSKIFIWRREIHSIFKNDPKSSLIWNGSPRDIGEARALIDFLLSIKRKNIVAINFTDSVKPRHNQERAHELRTEYHNELRRRVLSRGKSRTDDSEEAFKVKMKVYEEENSGTVAELISRKVSIKHIPFRKDENEESVFNFLLLRMQEVFKES